MLPIGGLSSLFRRPFLLRVALNRHLPALRELKAHYRGDPALDNCHRLRDWFDFFYGVLSDKYRCEYIYKNTIANKLYLDGHHSLKDSLLTDELLSGKSKADVVILNSTSTVYEIKSEYDSFRRLDSQLADYRKVFDRIIVVTTPNKAPLVMELVEDNVGIMSLDANGELEEVKKPIPNKANTDPAAVFGCMRQAEYCGAVSESFGYVPEVPNSLIYREARKLFCQLDPSQAHDLMVKYVKTRRKKPSFYELVEEAPESLKHVCLTFSKSPKLAIRIKERLSEPPPI